MAIYSLSHNPVGRTTHAAGTAGAHARYVTRDGAARDILGEHMPLGRETSQAWLDAQEAADRKNARVIDKVMVALPVELDAAERSQLVRDFAAEVGGGRIAWLAGIHDRGEDAHNPHAHVIFRDRDIETGKRAVGLSEKGSTDRLRETWERVANAALEHAGLEQRIDRRSLEAQGVDRTPGIHVGAAVLAMEERGIRPRSEIEIDADGRVINWPEIDRGRSRIDYLAEIEAANENQERERGREKGDKGRSDPMPTAVEAERVGLTSDQAHEPPREPERQGPILGGMEVASSRPEAIQRAPYAVENRQPPPEQALSRGIGQERMPAAAMLAPHDQAGDRQAEVSRLRLAIDRARERLDALGNRLEQAFDRFREAWQRKRQAELDPLEEARRKLAVQQPTPERRSDGTRSLFDDLRRGRQMRPPGWAP